MPTIDPTTLTPEGLAPMLRAWAAGLYPGEAAVGLLIAHERWLRRADFLRELVDAVDDGWGPRGTIVPMAAVDWERAAAFAEQAAASSSEVAVLKLAASLAGAQVPASVLELTASLDHTNGRHVLDALAHRFGWHEHGTVHLVTGHQAGTPTRQAATPGTAFTFDQVRAQAQLLLDDAANWLQTDLRWNPAPSEEARRATCQAYDAIRTAQAALERAGVSAAVARVAHQRGEVGHG